MSKKKGSAAPPPPAVEQEPKKRAIDFRWIPIDFLVPNTWNPNHQDDLTFNLLQDEIAETGLIDPVEVVPLEDGMYRIIGGEHRWRAAKNLGHEEVPCIVLTEAKWTDEDLQKFVTVRLNVIHGKLDPDKFLVLYKDMAAKYGEEAMQRMMGYADSQKFQKMLGWVKKGLKDSLPKEMAKDVEEATKEVKSVEDLGRIIQELFNKYGETVNQSFMVFTFGKQQHIYIGMDAKMRRAMDKVMECCRLLGQDINDFMKPVVDECLKKAVSSIEEKKQADAVSGSAPVAVIKTGW